jgi:uncharacterized protein involved in exopolysaccharide biosynthesis
MQPRDQPNQEESMNLIEFLLIVWNGKWIVLGITVLMVGLAVVYIVVAREWYTAEVLLKPMDSRQGLSNQAGALGGLATLAGISMGASPSAEPIAVLTSRELTSAFIQEKNLLPVLFPRMWDAQTKRWKADVEKPPDLRDGVRFFAKKIRTVVEEKKTGLVTLSIEWTDAETAALWANLLVERTNDRMQQRALTEAEANVAYLKEQLAMSTLVTMQQSIGRVLESELQKLLLARANNEFAFRILDHPEIPKSPSKPQRVLIIAAAFFGGGGVSVAFLMFRNVFRRRSIAANGPAAEQ